METHPADQTTFFVSGEGQAVVDGSTHQGRRQPHDRHPKGRRAQHHQQGLGPLKLFSVYAPPAEPAGVSHRTKAEAEAAEEGFVSRAAKKLKEAVGR